MRISIICLCLIGCGGTVGGVSIQEIDDADVDSGNPQPQAFYPGELCCQAIGEGLSPWMGDAASITAAGVVCFGPNGNEGAVVECVWSPGGSAANSPPSLEQLQGEKTK